jgi:hypothetical protein
MMCAISSKDERMMMCIISSKEERIVMCTILRKEDRTKRGNGCGILGFG